MAQGAGAGRLQRLVLSETLRLALAGTAASLALSRLIAWLLFDTSPWDVFTYLAVALAVVCVAALSGYLPARRAARIDPMVALRSN